MKVSCDVIKDILPLYAEDLISNDTKNLVEEHICDCESCKGELENIFRAARLPVDTDSGAMNLVNKEIRKRRWSFAAQAIIIVLAVFVIIINCLVVPVNIPTDEAFEYIFTDEQGRLFCKLQEGTYNYTVHKCVLDGEEKLTVHIYPWRNFTDWYYLRDQSKDPGGYEFKIHTGDVDMIERVVFGTDNRVVWGSDLEKDTYIGPTLPQTIMMVSAVIAVGLSVVYMLRKKHSNVILYTLLLFWSYVASNLLTIKFNYQSFFTLTDEAAAIVLIMLVTQTLLIYASIMLGVTRQRKYNQ